MKQNNLELSRSQPNLDRERIEALAYQLWLERGAPEGSAEIDWMRAEEELRTGSIQQAA